MNTTECACGCGKVVTFKPLGKADLIRRGERRFIRGHQNKGLKHSLEHIAKSTHTMQDNGRWKGGRAYDGDGYVKIKQPLHPFAHKDGYILEHHLVMEKNIGRFLERHEVVHHINGIRDDNRIENLELFSNTGQHSILEHTGRIYKCKQPRIAFVCQRCGVVFLKSMCHAKIVIKHCSWKCRYNKY